MTGAAAADDADVRIAPLTTAQRHEAARLLFDWYTVDARFGELYAITDRAGFTPLRPVFRSIVAQTEAHPSLLLGAFAGRRVVGLVATSPTIPGSLGKALRHRPLLTLLLLLEGYLRTWDNRSRLVGEPARRWRSYCRLVKAHVRPLRRLPRHQVMALAVHPGWRGRGLSRRLLAAVEVEPLWAACEALQVNTWHPELMAIYQRLGFAVADAGEERGVRCWTMLRPIVRDGAVAVATADRA